MKPKQNIVLSNDFHRGKAVITLRFDYNLKIINRVKSLEARWSASKKRWYLLKHDFYLSDVLDALESVTHIDYSVLKINDNTKQFSQKLKPKTEIKVKLPSLRLPSKQECSSGSCSSTGKRTAIPLGNRYGHKRVL